MPSIGQTWVLASIGAVVEMGVLSTLKRLLMESRSPGASKGNTYDTIYLKYSEHYSTAPPHNHEFYWYGTK
jgi:hypothetical protein